MQALMAAVRVRHMLQNDLGALEVPAGAAEHHDADAEFANQTRNGQGRRRIDFIEATTRQAPTDNGIPHPAFGLSRPIPLLQRRVKSWIELMRHADDVVDPLQVIDATVLLSKGSRPIELRLALRQSDHRLDAVGQVAEKVVLDRPIGKPLLPGHAVLWQAIPRPLAQPGNVRIVLENCALRRLRDDLEPTIFLPQERECRRNNEVIADTAQAADRRSLAHYRRL